MLQRAGLCLARAQLDIPICFLTCPSQQPGPPLPLPGAGSLAKLGYASLARAGCGLCASSQAFWNPTCGSREHDQVLHHLEADRIGERWG